MSTKTYHILTSREMIANLKADNPTRRFAHNPEGNAIAVWHEGQWVPLVGRLIGDLGWARINSQLVVNGQPVWFDWAEVL